MQVYQNKEKGFKENNTIQQIWFKYFPYWPLFILFLALSVAGAWLYIRYKTVPLYEATAVILINDEKKGQDDSKILESIDQLSSKNIIENEIEIIKSKILMTDVVKKLHLYAPVYEEGKIRPLLAYETSPIEIEADNPDSLSEANKIFFKYDTAKQQVTIDNNQYPVSKWVTTPYGTLRFLPHNTQASFENPLYFSLINPKAVAAALVAGLQVEVTDKLSTILNLIMIDGDPKRAEDILDGLILAFNNSENNQKKVVAARTLASLDERLGKVVHELDSIEQQLQQYKSNKGAINISSQSSLFLQNVSANDQKLNDINMQLSVLDQVENYVKAKDNNGSFTPANVGMNDPMLGQMLGKLYDTQLQYEKLKRTTAENNPMLLSLKDQMEKIKPGILDNIHSQRQGLEAGKNILNSTNNTYNSVLQTIPKKERDIVEISRQQNIKSDIYNWLLQKREETTLSLVSSVTNNKIVDAPQASYTPISPNKKKIYASAILLALLLGIGLITVNDMFKRTILYRQEIESYTSIPVIGEIIYQKTKEPLVIGNGRRTFIAEQFRNLRTTLPYIGLNGERKKLQVTSSVSGEGKSFIVANLGIGLAMTGKKVIVLEFDLSDPTLSNKLKVTEVNKGLTDYLTGQAEPDEIIQKTPVHENLYIMPAGWLPENPSELILSEKVPELLKYLSTTFDYIIIDTAPVGLLSDAYILSAYCDATLYVVRHKHTRKVSIQRLDANNKINELKNMAIVFNGVRARGFGKNGYGYGYGYGYIYKESKKKRKLLGRTSVS